MKLTRAQKEINDSPLYWAWFKKWWDEDFSYEAIIEKDTFSQADLTLFERFSSQKRSFAGREWHPFNIPPHDLDGNIPTSELDSTSNLIGNAYRQSKIIGVIRKDFHSASFKATSAFWCRFDSQHGDNQKMFENCLFEASGLSGEKFSFCYFLNSTISCSRSVNFENCYFNTNLKISTSHSDTILINKGIGLDVLHVTNFSNLNFSKTRAKNLHLSPNHNATISIHVPSKFSSNILVKNPPSDVLSKCSIVIKGGAGHDIKVENFNIDILNSDGHPYGDLKFDTLKSISLLNCTLSSELSLSIGKIERIYCNIANFSKGIHFEGGEVSGIAKFTGCRIFERAVFDESVFKGGFVFRPSKHDDNKFAEALLENSSFEGSIFTDSVKDRKSSCVNFNDAIFTGSASFNKAIFDGVPKFHGTSLHAETSFLDLGKIPDIDGRDIGKSELYSSYQAAFRTLRQHMEKNNSSAMAFEFGRREMIAKQRRREFVDVPKSEIIFTRWYGNLANYGQDFVRPLKFLLRVWLFSITFQLLLFLLTSSTCYDWNEKCKIDWYKAGEAFERGTTFALPPFTMLTNRSIDSNTDLRISWFTDLLSGGGMVLHAAASALLLFLFALGVKRKMQIK